MTNKIDTQIKKLQRGLLKYENQIKMCFEDIEKEATSEQNVTWRLNAIENNCTTIEAALRSIQEINHTIKLLEELKEEGGNKDE